MVARGRDDPTQNPCRQNPCRSTYNGAWLFPHRLPQTPQFVAGVRMPGLGCCFWPSSRGWCRMRRSQRRSCRAVRHCFGAHPARRRSTIAARRLKHRPVPSTASAPPSVAMPPAACQNLHCGPRPRRTSSLPWLRSILWRSTRCGCRLRGARLRLEIVCLNDCASRGSHRHRFSRNP